MLFRFFWAFVLSLLAAQGTPAATVLVLKFHNNSQYPDLNWVGESVAETLNSELGSANQIVIGRDSRSAGIRSLSLRPEASFTKASLIRIGQTLGADYLFYGSYDITLPSGDTELKNSSIQLNARSIDLRKMHDGPNFSETGKLAELSRFEEHLAWQAFKYLDPGSNPKLDRFLAPEKLIRLDAQESYVRGLLSSNPDQQQKWFLQSLLLDPKFASPAFELGKLGLARKDYGRAISWFQHIPASDSRYLDARFQMGLCSYGQADYSAAGLDFQTVLKTFPLGELYNNLGSAENQLGLAVAVDDFRRALDGDPNDPVYLFNLGSALLRTNSFDEALHRLQAVADHDPDDAEVRSLLERAKRREFAATGAKPLPNRLKTRFDETAFRQLKAMVQPKGSSE